MPYIPLEQRPPLDEHIDALSALAGDSVNPEGRCNYIISKLLSQVFMLKSSPRYLAINSAIGVLECAKLEVYRRLAAGYEDKKLAESGDFV